jgi:hypothetical protein
MKWIDTGADQMINSLRKSVTSLLLPMLIGGCNAAPSTSFEVWREEISCGNMTFKIQSECRASGSSEEINQCKSQALSNTNINNWIPLPQPKKSDKEGMERAGVARRLWATSWRCVTIDTTNYLRIDFSTGGGREAYDEYVEAYDEYLHPTHLDDKTKYSLILKNSLRTPAIPIKSIMPIDETSK